MALYLKPPTCTCKTSNVVYMYLIECKKYGKQYVGEMENALHLFMSDPSANIGQTGSGVFLRIGINSPSWSLSKLTGMTKLIGRRRKVAGFSS